MRTRTVLQVPMSPDLRSAATKVAEEMGFSSLQEAVRLLLKKISLRRLSINVEDNIIPLSMKNEKQYMKMRRDFKTGKNMGTAKDVKELMKQLNGN